jgi:predicted ATP-dependent endonuclease of OLD family
MYIKTLELKNFKTFSTIKIHFDANLNVLTGANNCGKTTILEALSLWNECFNKLIHQAKRGENN